MSKVLLLTLEYPPFFGGVANYYANLVKYWPEPQNIYVLDNQNNKLLNPTLPLLKWLPAFWQLRQVIGEQKINYLLVGHLLPLGTVAFFFLIFKKLSYTVFLHGLDFSQAMKIKRKKWLAKKILLRADKIICANSYTADLVKNFLPVTSQNKIQVVNPGLETEVKVKADLTAHLKKHYQLENKIILLSIGRLIKRKGFDRVVAALPTVLKQIANLIYIIVGNGPELDNLKLKIRNSNLDEKVILITGADDDEKNAWLQLADIFIMTARNMAGDFEGFGIVYLEAGRAGKPVIAGDSGGVRDAVIDKVNGLLVNPENLSAISQAITKLASQPKLRQSLGQNGRERALNQFNCTNQAKKTYQLINKSNLQ